MARYQARYVSTAEYASTLGFSLEDLDLMTQEDHDDLELMKHSTNVLDVVERSHNQEDINPADLLTLNKSMHTVANITGNDYLRPEEEITSDNIHMVSTEGFLDAVKDGLIKFIEWLKELPKRISNFFHRLKLNNTVSVNSAKKKIRDIKEKFSGDKGDNTAFGDVAIIIREGLLVGLEPRSTVQVRDFIQAINTSHKVFTQNIAVIHAQEHVVIDSCQKFIDLLKDFERTDSFETDSVEKEVYTKFVNDMRRINVTGNVQVLTPTVGRDYAYGVALREFKAEENDQSSLKYYALVKPKEFDGYKLNIRAKFEVLELTSAFEKQINEAIRESERLADNSNTLKGLNKVIGGLEKAARQMSMGNSNKKLPTKLFQLYREYLSNNAKSSVLALGSVVSPAILCEYVLKSVEKF